MSDVFDNQINDAFNPTVLSFTCPRCGHEIRESIGELKGKSELTCSDCGHVAPLDSRGLNQINEVLKEWLRQNGQSFV